MDWWKILSAVMVLGPGSYVLGKWIFTSAEPDREKVLLVLVWTFFCLAYQYKERLQLSKDHKEACERVEALIEQSHPEEFSNEYFDIVPEWCSKYSQAYQDILLDAKDFPR